MITFRFCTPGTNTREQSTVSRGGAVSSRGVQLEEAHEEPVADSDYDSQMESQDENDDYDDIGGEVDHEDLFAPMTVVAPGAGKNKRKQANSVRADPRSQKKTSKIDKQGPRGGSVIKSNQKENSNQAVTGVLVKDEKGQKRLGNTTKITISNAVVTDAVVHVVPLPSSSNVSEQLVDANDDDPWGDGPEDIKSNPEKDNYKKPVFYIDEAPQSTNKNRSNPAQAVTIKTNKMDREVTPIWRTASASSQVSVNRGVQESEPVSFWDEDETVPAIDTSYGNAKNVNTHASLWEENETSEAPDGEKNLPKSEMCDKNNKAKVTSTLAEKKTVVRTFSEGAGMDTKAINNNRFNDNSTAEPASLWDEDEVLPTQGAKHNGSKDRTASKAVQNQNGDNSWVSSKEQHPTSFSGKKTPVRMFKNANELAKQSHPQSMKHVNSEPILGNANKALPTENAVCLKRNSIGESNEMQGKTISAGVVTNRQTLENNTHNGKVNEHGLTSNGATIKPGNAWASLPDTKAKSRRNTPVKQINLNRDISLIDAEPVFETNRLAKRFPFLVNPETDEISEEPNFTERSTSKQVNFVVKSTNIPGTSPKKDFETKTLAAFQNTVFGGKQDSNKSNKTRGALSYGFGVSKARQYATAWMNKLKSKWNPVQTANTEWN